VDKGDLWQAITSKQRRWDRVFVGLLQTDALFNIGRALHEGATIPVTKKMRAMFFYLWLASQQAQGHRTGRPVRLTGRAAELFDRFKDWKPLRDTTTAIKIPPRPFIAEALNDDAKQKMKLNWANAVQAAIREHIANAKKKRR
jgi:hypothetical protein